MRNGLMASALAFLVSLGCDAATAASIRDIYFSKGELVEGQRYQRDSQLPGPATTFTRDQDKVARLFVVLNDRAAHVFTVSSRTRRDAWSPGCPAISPPSTPAACGGS